MGSHTTAPFIYKEGHMTGRGSEELGGSRWEDPMPAESHEGIGDFALASCPGQNMTLSRDST